MPKITF